MFSLSVLVAEPTSQEPDTEPLSRTQILIAMGFTAVLLLLVTKFWLQFDAVAVVPVRWSGSALLLGVGAAAVVSLVSALVYQFWPGYRQAANFYLQLILKPLLWPDIIWLGLLPGLSEELLFRGVMLPALGFNWAALIGSSLCFGILHLSSLQQWPYGIWATLVGLFLGFCTLSTGNLLIPIVAHVLTNLISSLLWKLNDAQQHS